VLRSTLPRTAHRPALVALAIGLSLSALPAAKAQAPKPAPAAEAESEEDKLFKSIEWTKGPEKVVIGDQGELQVPEGLAFTAGDGTRKMMKLMQNPTDGSELGLLTTGKLEWFVLFEFEDIGYVKDADKEKLDSAEILDSIREGNEAGNEERARQGWPPIKIVGWHTSPFYNKDTNNLEWCIEGESEGRKIVNYNTRILGRRGVMSANLLVRPDRLNETLPEVKKILAGYTFTAGQRYGEWKAGDKVAKYGLSALVVGGAVGMAAKMGFFAKLAASLGKLWKFIILGLIGVGAFLKKLLTGRQKEPEQAEVPPAQEPPASQG
jgi:uncharacterized membrane-anchored protein